jgi:hypothetical protein
MGCICSTHGELKIHTKFLLESRNGTDHSKDLGVGGRIILKSVIKNTVGRSELDSSGSEQGPVAVSCEQGTERFASMTGGE